MNALDEESVDNVRKYMLDYVQRFFEVQFSDNILSNGNV